MIKTLSFDFTGGIKEALQQRQDDRQNRLDRFYIVIGFAAALCIIAHLPYVSNACQEIQLIWKISQLPCWGMLFSTLRVIIVDSLVTASSNSL